MTLSDRFEFEIVDSVADFSGAFIIFDGDGVIEFAAEADQERPVIRGTGVRRLLSDMFGVAMHSKKERLKLLFKEFIVVRTAEPTVFAEFLKTDPASRTGSEIEFHQFTSRFLETAHLLFQLFAQFFGRILREIGDDVPVFMEIFVGVFFAKMKFDRLLPRHFGDMKRGGPITFLTFHVIFFMKDNLWGLESIRDSENHEEKISRPMRPLR